MSNVGPVIMAHPIARGALESTGACMSFRTSDRTTGHTHYRYERTGTKQGDVTISQVSDEIEPTAENLHEYRPLSGFSNTEQWREAIEEVHGSTDVTGYVYRIELQE
jgi:hypothetical protein